ncbi:neuronal acetylcholine receptor subunit alpha-10-like [Ylistrum balloti]|uniref:neuronal acetylcholine receptor subunit alpha-10-like n=1 Tax=Ylistrum balloti TaxID=509963 RepID=UPI002905B6CC|nr:neuronal acetylcholine receptor subunit alpha-10-like [Ylistrum balloti]
MTFAEFICKHMVETEATSVMKHAGKFWEHLIETSVTLLWIASQGWCTTTPRIPDEQRLYQSLMVGYEKSVRPVINASTILMVKFGLRLNQIVDLDERHQVLTTNVFIDQEWLDENLYWDPVLFNSIRSLRIPARNVWLPDTFIYNNADDGSTGFMQGTYVLVNYNGTVKWPVPVKLKSSCKVDITYFPFDDQECILRFGSWIYSGLWMDYFSEHNETPINLGNYVDNSEWDLLSVKLKKNIRTHSCCPDPHPDMTYVLHIRRKTFYYIFNIIVPCVMLSTLTLLTFWLPPTSGEKITLGLSVFLAFSMFMLLIAEEVPATSEAVPLIGIYLCVVMTMTSLSVIMAVMVINLYNRGMKTRRAPNWLRHVALKWLSRPLQMKHDIQKVAKAISLEDELEGAYRCKKHGKLDTKNIPNKSSPDKEDTAMLDKETTIRNRRYDKNDVMTTSFVEENDEQEVIWLRREDFKEETAECSRNTWADLHELQQSSKDNNNRAKKGARRKTSGKAPAPAVTPVLQDETKSTQTEGSLGTFLAECRNQNELFARKLIVAEWQRIAAVTDRILFWFYFLSTLTSYIVILIVVPNSNYSRWNEEILPMHTVTQAS